MASLPEFKREFQRHKAYVRDNEVENPYPAIHKGVQHYEKGILCTGEKRQVKFHLQDIRQFSWDIKKFTYVYMLAAYISRSIHNAQANNQIG